MVFRISCVASRIPRKCIFFGTFAYLIYSITRHTHLTLSPALIWFNSKVIPPIAWHWRASVFCYMWSLCYLLLYDDWTYELWNPYYRWMNVWLWRWISFVISCTLWSYRVTSYTNAFQVWSTAFTFYCILLVPMSQGLNIGLQIHNFYMNGCLYPEPLTRVSTKSCSFKISMRREV
jgi:hypothetical protein